MDKDVIGIGMEKADHARFVMDPHSVLIDFGWPVTSLCFYLYFNIAIIIILWLAGNIQPETRERFLRKLFWTEIGMFSLFLIWSIILLWRLNTLPQGINDGPAYRGYTQWHSCRHVVSLCFQQWFQVLLLFL